MTRRGLFATLCAPLVAPLIPKPVVSDFTVWTHPVVLGVLNVGDIFTAEGYFAHDPRTRRPLPYLQKFVVTAVPPNGGLHGTEFRCWPQIS